MADEKDPYAKYVTASPAEEDPYAKYVTPPDVLEDVGKGAVSGLGQGIISIPSFPGDVSHLAEKGIEKAGEITGIHAPDPLGWMKQKLEGTFPNAMKFMEESNKKSANVPAAQVGSGDLPGSYEMPTSGDIQQQVEKVTGPFYQAQTPYGKAAQTTGQVLPAIAMGPESLLGVGAKSAGAGVVSELAGEGADKLKGHLPDYAQPYAEPVARMIGAGAGATLNPFASIPRKVVTPLPMTDQRLATVDALRQTNPELVNASSAGQLTESPRVAGLEARSPRMADLPQRQNEAYTQSVMRQAGAPGSMFDTAGLAQSKDTGAQLEALRNAHTMSPAEFSNLNSQLKNDYINLQTHAGKEASSPFFNFKEDVRQGPNRGVKNFPTGQSPLHPTDMSGERFGDLSQMAQSAGSGASPTSVATALFDARQKLKDAFHNSMPPDEAQHLRDLDQQYSNYKAIENIPREAGGNTLTPQQVHSKAPVGSGLETHADQAAQVMTPLPKPNMEGNPGIKMLGAVVGGIGGGGAGALLHSPGHGLDSGLLASFYGAGHANDVVQALKNSGGRIVARPGMQSYLKNQAWRPGSSSSVDPAILARLLMTPPAKQAVSPDQPQ